MANLLNDPNYMSMEDTGDGPSQEQLLALQQMAGQAAPIPQSPMSAQQMQTPMPLPPPPTPNPMSRMPVPQQKFVAAGNTDLVQHIKNQGLQQQLEADKLRQYMQNYAGMNQGTDYRALAAFASTLPGGSKQIYDAAEALAPESQAKRAENLIGQQQALTKLAGDQQANKVYADMLRAQQQAAYQNSRADVMRQGLDLRTGKEARTTIKNDPILKQYIPRLEGAAKIGELIDAANNGQVVSNQALLGQLNAEISRLETGSQSPGLGASEKTELLDKKAQMQSFYDSITGDPKDAVRPEVINAAGKLVNELKGSYQRGIDSRFGLLKAGMTPPQQDIADAKHESIQQTYAPRFGGSWNGQAVDGVPQAPPPLGPQTKNWNGKTYKIQGDHWVEVK